MSENNFTKGLADYTEKELADFFNLSWLEKLEKAEKFFQNSRNTDNYQTRKKISLMFKEMADSQRKYLESASKEHKDFSESARAQYFYAYIDRQFQDLIDKLPYYFLFAHIVCDGTYYQTSFEVKQQLREICGLQNAKDRRDTFANLFSFLIKEKVVQGGSEGFWSQANSLYFLSIYNRFQIVIKNARKDLEKQKDIKSNRQYILEKYEIPQEYIDETFSKKDFNPSELALDWALKIIGCEAEDAAKALKTARKKAGKYQKDNSKKLISVYRLNLNLAILSTTLPPEMKANLCFSDFRINNRTMLYYI